MKELTCPECGDTIVIATNPAEYVVRGQTPVEHMERTGHRDPRAPEPPTDQ